MELPENIQFETNTDCRKSCRFCIHDRMDPRPRASDELIEKIIDELVPTAKFVQPYLFQEPLLEPRLPEILRQIKLKNRNVATAIYTTGDGLSKSMMESLIGDQCLDELYLSFRGSNNDGVENFKKMLKYRNEFGYKMPKSDCIVLAIPSNRFPDDELVSLVDNVRYFQMDTLGGSVEFWGDKEELKQMELQMFGPEPTVRFPCSYVDNSFTIHSNGDVVSCCVDWRGSEPFGNMYESSAMEIFNSDEYKTFRRLHREGKYNLIPQCRNCITYRWSDQSRNAALDKEIAARVDTPKTI
jgi:radical SAM protein with 4Fe4S-binding SPASM domain